MYAKAIRLEKSGDHQAAAQAFEKFLRISPGDQRVHVHLGMLYEDHLGDPVAALYHYSRGCQGGAQDAHAEFARSSMARLSRAFVEGLLNEDADGSAADAESESVEELRQAIRELSEQRVFLLSQLKSKTAECSEAHAQIAELRQKLEPPDFAPEVPPSPGVVKIEALYTVKKGDTLIGISRERYGTAGHWQALRNYNRDLLKGSDVLKPGMQMRIPDVETLKREVGDGT